MNTLCIECYFKKHLSAARSLGSEEKATAFGKALMRKFLEQPDSGRILMNDRDLLCGIQTEEQLRENRLHFGLVFQNFNLFPQYTALTNVTLAHKLSALKKPETKANRKEVFDKIQTFSFSDISEIAHAQTQVSFGFHVAVSKSAVYFFTCFFLLMPS